MGEPKGAEDKGRSQSREKTRLWLAAIVLLALALRLAFVSGLAPGAAFASVDAQGYYLLATNLVERGVFSLEGSSPYVPDGIRTPLYPALLAGLLLVTDEVDQALPVFQAVLDTATAVLVYCLACRLAGRRRGLAAALLCAVNPVSMLYIGEALTEVVAAFLVALTCTLFVAGAAHAEVQPLRAASQRGRYANMAATGLAGALCILCKPNVVLLPLILGGSLFFRRRLLWRRAGAEAGLLIGVALLAVSPWLVRNRITFGRWFLSLAVETTRAHVSAVATILEAQGEEVAPWTPRWEETYMSRVVVPTSKQYGWAEGSKASTAREAADRTKQLATVAGRVIRQHRRAFLASHLKGVVRSFVPSLQRYWYAYFRRTPWPEGQALGSALAEARDKIGQGEWAGGLEVLRTWWRQQPMPGRGLWVASAMLSAVSYVLVVAGLWSLRRQPVAVVSLGLLLLYLVVLPGPIAYLRFWVPGVPVAAAVMGCAFMAGGKGSVRRLPPSRESEEERVDA